jgi:predicted dehydrogenase
MSEGAIRVGFIGAGANTKLHHIPKLRAQPGVVLVGVANRSKQSGEKVAKEFDISKVFGDWREVVVSPEVDAICIGTWPYMHAEMSIAALAAGKHVLCEARMAMNAAEGRRMLEAARKAPKLIAQLVPAPHTLETDPTMTALIKDGFVGDVLAVELHAAQGRFVDPAAPLHWRQDITLSGHNILNMGIWYEAMCRWLGHAKRLTAMTRVSVPKRKDADGKTHDVKVPDHADILAELAGSGIAHMRFSAVTALAPPAEVWIYGSEGTIRLEADAKRLWGARKGDSALKEIVIPKEKRVGWRVEEEFVNAIRGKEKITRTSFEEGVRYMEFTDAVTKSAATGQAVDVKPL